MLSEPNFYETIEEIVNGACAESVFNEQATEGNAPMGEEMTIDTTSSPSGTSGAPLPAYHRSRVCTPSPRRRWTLKPLLPGSNPALTGSVLQLRSVAISPGIATNSSAVDARRMSGTAVSSARRDGDDDNTECHVSEASIPQHLFPEIIAADEAATGSAAQLIPVDETYENLPQRKSNEELPDEKCGSCSSSSRRLGGKVKEIVDCLERAATTTSKNVSTNDNAEKNDVTNRKGVSIFGLKVDFFAAARSTPTYGDSAAIEPHDRTAVDRRPLSRRPTVTSSSSFSAVKAVHRRLSSAIRRLASTGGGSSGKPVRKCRTDVQRRRSTVADRRRHAGRSAASQSGALDRRTSAKENCQVSGGGSHGSKGCVNAGKERGTKTRGNRHKPAVPYKPERLRSKPTRNEALPEAVATVAEAPKGCAWPKKKKKQQQQRQSLELSRHTASRPFAATATGASHLATRHAFAYRKSSQLRQASTTEFRSSSDGTVAEKMARSDPDDDALAADYQLERHRQSDNTYWNLEERLFSSDLDASHLYYDLDDGRPTLSDGGSSSFRATTELRLPEAGSDDRTAGRHLVKPPVPPKPSCQTI